MDIIIIKIGIGLVVLGTLGYIISAIMVRHYDRKLFLLNQKLRKDDKWRKESTKEARWLKEYLLNFDIESTILNVKKNNIKKKI